MDSVSDSKYDTLKKEIRDIQRQYYCELQSALNTYAVNMARLQHKMHEINRDQDFVEELVWGFLRNDGVGAEVPASMRIKALYQYRFTFRMTSALKRTESSL